jgi:hypothetical protein
MLKPQEQFDPLNRGYEIYALVDPRDNLVRYVGLSIDAQIRFIGHLKGAGANEADRQLLSTLKVTKCSLPMRLLK